MNAGQMRFSQKFVLSGLNTESFGIGNDKKMVCPFNETPTIFFDYDKKSIKYDWLRNSHHNIDLLLS